MHSLAPEARITSVKVLGAGLTGKAAAFLRGLAWAVEQGFDVINLSLGTTKREWALPFYEVCDEGYFKNSVIVTAANNIVRPSFPSLFASVTSVASNLSKDPFRFHYNPEPPTEFLAPGIDVDVAWRGGSRVDRDRELLRRSAHRGHRRADPLEAPRTAAVPDEDRALGNRRQRARGAPVRRPAEPDHAPGHVVASERRARPPSVGRATDAGRPCRT